MNEPSKRVIFVSLYHKIPYIYPPPSFFFKTKRSGLLRGRGMYVNAVCFIFLPHIKCVMRMAWFGRKCVTSEMNL